MSSLENVQIKNIKMTEEQIHNFEKVQAQLDSLHIEISILSKKSQNDALNKFKLKFVNQTLKEANLILTDKYKPFEDFEKFDDEDLPTNSDVNLILGQYLNCMEKLRTDNIERTGINKWVWTSNNKTTQIITSQPLKLKK